MAWFELPFYAVPLLYVIFQFLFFRRLANQDQNFVNIVGICKVAIGAVGCWILFHLFVVPRYGNVLLFSVFEVPHFVKCPFEHNKCSDGDVDGWSVYHLLDHFIAGLLYPHVRWEATFVFLQSLLCETGELIGGERARFIVDPGVNLLGYLIGHFANRAYRYARPLDPPSRNLGPKPPESTILLSRDSFSSKLELI
ncbi:hypothetical protein TrST_g539 [Triparma strigata]|uniref:Uncharacterized protein n=1 Tax=Triparma strigata TaxID=1606541 RepID=A0A9W7BSP9_9STRA|nr:hypothetical protein TrST_g539 [Triparma strigata]